MKRNWKTSAAGIIAGLPIAMSAIVDAYNAGYFTGKSGVQLAFSVGIVLLGILSKDHDVTGTTKPTE